MSSGSAGGVGSGGTTSTDPCEGAEEGQACDVEGARCGECSNDPCVFCNIMGCDQGVWQRFEAAPAPCFECGMELTCQQSQALCRIENGVVYDEACVPVPEACTGDLSCGCLESEMPEFTCTEVSPTSFVLERSDATAQ
jgi:hypothetical protein